MKFNIKESQTRSISDEKFKEMLESDEVEIFDAFIDYNDYGKFLFIALKFRETPDPNLLSFNCFMFFSYGYHSVWERVVTDKWTFFPYPKAPEKDKKYLRKSKENYGKTAQTTAKTRQPTNI